MLVPSIALALVAFVFVLTVLYCMDRRTTARENIVFGVGIVAICITIFLGVELVEYYRPTFRRRAGQVGIANTIIALAVGALLAVAIPERYRRIRFRR